MFPSAAELVARFLRSNGYPETLAAFLKEANMPLDAGMKTNDNITIEKILSEKQRFDTVSNFEKLGISEEHNHWTTPAPENPLILETLPKSSNILNVSIESVLSSKDDDISPKLVVSTADRRLDILSTSKPFNLINSRTGLLDSPILSHVIIRQRYLICTSISGKIALYDSLLDKLLDERQDHSKYAVKVVEHQLSEEDYLIATAGWDAKIVLYRIKFSNSSATTLLGEPLGSIKLPSNPEALLLVTHPESGKPILITTRRDSTFLYYYSAPDINDVDFDMEVLGKQNLAPHSNSWVAFTPTSIALCPTDPSIIAVATSTVPHLKLIITRLLLPPPNAELVPMLSDVPRSSNTDLHSLTQEAQGRAELALQDKEAAAIIIQCSTLAPQTAYSTPTVAWRPDGSGLWVNSDDGVVRGIEASTGKIMVKLEGHEPGSKIRCLWAGQVKVGGNGATRAVEFLVSGGFDQRLVIWNVSNHD